MNLVTETESLQILLEWGEVVRRRLDIKENKLCPVQRCRWTQRLSQSEVSQRKTNTVYKCIYVESRKTV